jgi:thiamine-monophosphate kinase
LELEFVRRLRTRIPPHRFVEVGPGDDAAVIALGGRTDCVVTTDMLMDGVDFVLNEADPRRIGRKALAVNLSDLAAMAAIPTAAVVSLALPIACGFALGHELYEGILPLAEEFDLSIAGGDTNTWNGPLVISITAIGRLTSRGPFLRSGARPGDVIVVTGEFGGSIAGKHFDFTPRVREALLLRERYDVHAAMDVSDGLSLDLHRLAEESRCGAELFLHRIPIADAAKSPAISRPALDRALCDGEDFELLLAVPPHEAERLCAEQPLGEVKLTTIGSFTTEPGLWSVEADGRRAPLAPRGYEHRMSE